jgi:deoxyribodipyrimidine photolyase-related protein
MINIGLLLPIEVIETSLNYAFKYSHEIPPNSIEGFIAQILGWREFTRAVYVDIGNKRIKTLPGNTRKLGPIWYKSVPETPFAPLNLALKHVRENAYCHHIERLMIIGQIMFMTRTDATEVYRWFMEFFLDSYDWVMVPNAYFMSQYANLEGITTKSFNVGVMTTRPYFSSSNYIMKMSDAQTRKWYNETTPDWDDAWDSLYWSTIGNHQIQPFLQRNYILAAQVAHYNKKSDEQRIQIDR